MSSLKHKLDIRKQADSLRVLPKTKGLIDFVSNDYLGLSRSEKLFDMIRNHSYQGITNLNGSTGSRLLAGNAKSTVNLENKLARIFHSDSTLLFNSGYVANLALLSSVPQRGDTIIYDQLSHVCLKEGATLSKAKSYSFLHNDCNDLEKKLKIAEGEKYVVIESVYSMDGDTAPFQDLIALCQSYDAKLIIDEAHGTGVYGKGGAGLICELGLEDSFFARVYTFGKAMGVHGACIAGTDELIEYLINFARPFIYTTALPVHSIFSIDSAFEYLDKHQTLQNDIQKKIAHFNETFENTIQNPEVRKLPSQTPIQPVVVTGNSRIKKMTSVMQEAGYDVRPILSPTVKEGTERLRITLHTHNTEYEIESLVKMLNSQL